MLMISGHNYWRVVRCHFNRKKFVEYPGKYSETSTTTYVFNITSTWALQSVVVSDFSDPRSSPKTTKFCKVKWSKYLLKSSFFFTCCEARSCMNHESYFRIILYLISIAPIKSIRLASKDIDNSQAVVYENGQSVRVREGEMHRFYCHINGSYPEPQVSIKIGDQDITHHFNISSKMLKEGSAKGIQSFYYKVDAKAHRLAMEYDYNGKELSCIAKIADYDKLTRKAGIRVFLSECKPSMNILESLISSETSRQM